MSRHCMMQMSNVIIHNNIVYNSYPDLEWPNGDLGLS